MNRYSAPAVLVLLAALCIYGQTSPATEEAAIRAQLTAYAAARSKGNGDAQAAFYSLDADEWGSNDKEMTVGRAAIAKKIALPPDPNRKIRMEPIRISFLSANVALVDATYGRTGAAPTGHALYVMVKRDGTWLIRSTRSARYPAPAAAK